MNHKKIVNIINFVRANEPRDKNLNLLETTKQQINLIKSFDLKSTFLMEYDAMIDEQFSNLIKSECNDNFEIGGWFEIVEPLVKKAGLVWKGRFPWDWNANVDFSIGYSNQEREKLVDTFMEDFKTIFGKYPESVGSWIIDAYTLRYMVDKYNIVASVNCKDQFGTDGYTLWGGYYSQAYYPSKKNVFMPAQNTKEQISIPIFRMLGSDPIYQYDSGLSYENGFVKISKNQPVITLEPVYPEGGGSSKWVKWYFDETFNNPCLSFCYSQVGQENSFGWESMKKGFTYQIEFISSMVKQGKISVEQLRESGIWFKSHYKLTPSSSLIAMNDWKELGHKSIWYNSRFYRANFYFDGSYFRIRDIHKFDENYKERYLTRKCNNKHFVYDTLPVIDGYLWSKKDVLAGVYLIEQDNLTVSLIRLDKIFVKEQDDTLWINLLTSHGNIVKIHCLQDKIEITLDICGDGFKIGMELLTGVNSSIKEINKNSISYNYNFFQYTVNIDVGYIKIENNRIFFWPENGKLIIKI
ncbi:MAG: hypothetical protein ACP5U0_09575 [Caldisphaera sp.]